MKKYLGVFVGISMISMAAVVIVQSGNFASLRGQMAGGYSSSGNTSMGTTSSQTQTSPNSSSTTSSSPTTSSSSDCGEADAACTSGDQCCSRICRQFNKGCGQSDPGPGDPCRTEGQDCQNDGACCSGACGTTLTHTCLPPLSSSSRPTCGATDGTCAPGQTCVRSGVIGRGNPYHCILLCETYQTFCGDQSTGAGSCCNSGESCDQESGTCSSPSSEDPEADCFKSGGSWCENSDPKGGICCAKNETCNSGKCEADSDSSSSDMPESVESSSFSDSSDMTAP